MPSEIVIQSAHGWAWILSVEKEDQGEEEGEQKEGGDRKGGGSIEAKCIKVQGGRHQPLVRCVVDNEERGAAYELWRSRLPEGVYRCSVSNQGAPVRSRDPQDLALARPWRWNRRRGGTDRRKGESGARRREPFRTVWKRREVESAKLNEHLARTA